MNTLSFNLVKQALSTPSLIISENKWKIALSRLPRNVAFTFYKRLGPLLGDKSRKQL
jgi:hypothetical protein